eukprot:519520-Prymnesium_polylepis.1
MGRAERGRIAGNLARGEALALAADRGVCVAGGLLRGDVVDIVLSRTVLKVQTRTRDPCGV